jgi:glycosyltransferase involved in cell wall biosynthesis
MDVARQALEKLIREPPVPWRLIVFGAMPSWMHVLRRDYPGRVVGLPWVDFGDYPQAIAWGGFDLALAPLQKHPFNDAKSNIKWQEAAVQRIPLVCSNTGPYDWDIPGAAALKAEQNPESWEEVLRAALTDPTLREKTVETAWQAVNDEWVVDRRGCFWETAIEEALSCPRIEDMESARLKAPAGEAVPSSAA